MQAGPDPHPEPSAALAQTLPRDADGCTPLPRWGSQVSRHEGSAPTRPDTAPHCRDGGHRSPAIGGAGRAAPPPSSKPSLVTQTAASHCQDGGHRSVATRGQPPRAQTLHPIAKMGVTSQLPPKGPGGSKLQACRTTQTTPEPRWMPYATAFREEGPGPRPPLALILPGPLGNRNTDLRGCLHRIPDCCRVQGWPARGIWWFPARGSCTNATARWRMGRDSGWESGGRVRAET